MFIIFGWMRRFTTLGVKTDECTTCGQVCPHVVGRKTHWGHVFWIPALFLGFSHGMICSACGAWSPLRWNAVRQAMKSGLLALDRPRPNGDALLREAAAEEGKAPPPIAAVFDPLMVNPKRGAWDLYLKAWPVMVALLLAVGALTPRPSAGTGSTPETNAAGVTFTESSHGPAHQCWEAADGSISGCRLASGLIDGVATGSPITCYFNEPLSPSETSLYCRSR